VGQALIVFGEEEQDGVKIYVVLYRLTKRDVNETCLLFSSPACCFEHAEGYIHERHNTPSLPVVTARFAFTYEVAVKSNAKAQGCVIALLKGKSEESVH
jgi:hypothetical protein